MLSVPRPSPSGRVAGVGGQGHWRGPVSISDHRTMTTRLQTLRWRMHRCLVGATLGVSVSLIVSGCANSIGTGHTHPSPTRTPRPAASSSPRSGDTGHASCIGANLRVTGNWQGATGSMLGGISFTNTASTPCTLSGYLTAELISQQGQKLPVQVQNGGPPGDALPSGAASLTVVLPAGKTNSASITVQWSNWCGPAPGTLTLVVVLPDSERLTVEPVFEPWGVARCDEPTAASVLYETPVQGS